MAYGRVAEGNWELTDIVIVYRPVQGIAALVTPGTCVITVDV